MNTTLIRFFNLIFDLLLWVSLWGIIDSIVTLITRNNKFQTYIYSIIFVSTIIGIYLVNGSFIYKDSLYG